MKKEFKLIEKKRYANMLNSNCEWVYPEEDIKEFIRLEIELINQFACSQITLLELKQEREDLIGDL